MNDKDLSALNDHLHRQLNMLGDPELEGEQLTSQIERSKAVSSLAKDVIATGRLVLDAQIRTAETISKVNLPKMLNSDANS